MISIHAAHEGQRLIDSVALTSSVKFQSTLPTKGSDALPSLILIHHKKFQSTLPTKGSDGAEATITGVAGISIHAAHEGQRRVKAVNADGPLRFQSTLPTKGSDCAALNL